MVSESKWEHYLVFHVIGWLGSWWVFICKLRFKLLNLRLLENFQIYKEKLFLNVKLCSYIHNDYAKILYYSFPHCWKVKVLTFFSVTKPNTFFSFVLFMLHPFLYHSVLIFQSTKGLWQWAQLCFSNVVSINCSEYIRLAVRDLKIDSNSLELAHPAGIFSICLVQCSSFTRNNSSI